MDNRTKVLLITPDLGLGGAQRFISLLANYINLQLFDIQLIIIDGAERFFEIRPEVKVIDLKITRTRHALLKIRKLIKATMPQVVFSTFGHLNLFLALNRFLFPKNIQFIARESNVATERFKDKTIKFSFISKVLYKTVFKKMDTIVCQSMDMKKSLQQLGIQHQNMVVINNPVALPEIQSKFAENQLPAYDMVSIGRLTYQKGYERLIRSMFEYKKQFGPNFKLAIIGDGEQAEKLQEIINTLGLSQNIHLLGRQTNPFKFINQKSLCIMTSHYEGFPNVLIEMGAIGIPTVAFKVPGGLDEIIAPAKNGFLVENGDLTALATTINKAKTYTFDQQEIINYTKSNFGVNAIIRQYEQLFVG